MEFKKLRLALISENALNEREQYKKLSEIKTQEDLNNFLKWGYSKRQQYKGTLKEQKQKAVLLIQEYFKKLLNKKMDFLKRVEESKDFNKTPLIVTIEWKPSKMWRSNPRAFNNFGFEGSSVGGCGYDKLSTAVAEALNNYLPLLKLLYKKKEEHIKTRRLNEDKTKMSTGNINRFYIGYGSGYDILPSFEGGVGTSCFRHIIENLGLKWINVTETANTNVYMITI